MAVVRRNMLVYSGLLLLGALPLINYESSLITATTTSIASSSITTKDVLNVVRTGYFAIVAMTIVYVGAQRQDIGMTQAPVSGKRAALAPVFAAFTLGTLYVLIKYTSFDPGTLYRIFTSFFGWVCIAEISQTLFGLSPVSQPLIDYFQIDDEKKEQQMLLEQEQEQSREQSQPPIMSQSTTGESELDNAKLRAGGLPAAILSTVLVLVYLTSVSSIYDFDVDSTTASLERLRLVATSNNYIATAIALATLGQIALESYVAGAYLLIGLFFYDALSVFKSDTMMTVATKIEAPVKFLFAGTVLPVEGGKYPFGVLGLGDIVIPGIFIAMLREFDVERWWNKKYDEYYYNYSKAATQEKQEKKPNRLFSIFQTNNDDDADDDRSSSDSDSDSDVMVVMNMISDDERRTNDNNNNGNPTNDNNVSLDFFKDAQTPYFRNGMVGYAFGLGATFFVLYSTGNGQPALFYIVPSLLVASLGTAVYRDEVSELWSYEGARAREAREAQEVWKKEKDERNKIE